MSIYIIEVNLFFSSNRVIDESDVELLLWTQIIIFHSCEFELLLHF